VQLSPALWLNRVRVVFHQEKSPDQTCGSTSRQCMKNTRWNACCATLTKRSCSTGITTHQVLDWIQHHQPSSATSHSPEQTIPSVYRISLSSPSVGRSRPYQNSNTRQLSSDGSRGVHIHYSIAHQKPNIHYSSCVHHLWSITFALFAGRSTIAKIMCTDQVMKLQGTSVHTFTSTVCTCCLFLYSDIVILVSTAL